MLTATDLLIILAILDTHKPPPPAHLVARHMGAHHSHRRQEVWS